MKLATGRREPAMVSPVVLAALGASFSAALSPLHRSLSNLGSLTPEQQEPLGVVLTELGRLEHLGVQIQAVARGLIGEVAAQPEPVDLARAAREAFAHRMQPGGAGSSRLEVTADPCTLDADPALLDQLLELGFEYTSHYGPNIMIEAALRGTPAHPELSIRAERQGTPRAADDGFVELRWLLFASLARAAGLAPRRLVEDRTVALILGFRGVDAAEVPADTPSPAEVSRTASVTGRRVLLVESQEIVRVHAYNLMREAGMRVNAVAGIEQAQAALRESTPEIVVTGMPLDEASCSALLSDARAAQPRLRVIQLVDDDDAFSFSVPGSGRPAQVARHNLDRTLVEAVAEELDSA